MHLRKSTVFFLFLFINIALFAGMFVDASQRLTGSVPSILEKRRLVKELRLTDLCLFTDTRYTRHPSMADLFSPFQEHPSAFEHFPSGSLMMPPPHLRRP